MLGVVGEGQRNAGEHVLIGLTGQQIAILERLLAEFGQKGITRRIHHNRAAFNNAQQAFHSSLGLTLAERRFRHSFCLGCRHKSSPSESIDTYRSGSP